MSIVAALDAAAGAGLVLTHYAPGEVCAPHRHGDAQVSLLLAGEYRELSPEGERRVDRPALSVKPARFEHENAFGDGGALILSLNLAAAPVLADYRVAELALAAADGAARLAEAARGGSSAVAALSLRLAPASLSPPFPDAGLEAARRGLARGELTRSAAAARLLGLHRVQFAREFRRAFGQPPTTLRRWSRLTRAIGRIVRTSEPLAEVAAAEDFADQAHLTRELKAAVGLTPARLRRLFARPA